MRTFERFAVTCGLLLVASAYGQEEQISSSAPSVTTMPSSQPSIQPTTGPTTSSSPSSFPSIAPSLEPSTGPSEVPTNSPTTFAPTTAPTFDPDLPPNDRCERAFELGVDGASEGWVNSNSTIGTRCRAPAQGGPSVWYRFVGTGERLSILLCDNDASVDSGINIYKSQSGDCGLKFCGLNSRFAVSPCGSDKAAGVTTLRSQAGYVYYVEVMTFGPKEGTTGLVRVQTA